VKRPLLALAATLLAAATPAPAQESDILDLDAIGGPSLPAAQEPEPVQEREFIDLPMPTMVLQETDGAAATGQPEPEPAIEGWLPEGWWIVFGERDLPPEARFDSEDWQNRGDAIAAFETEINAVLDACGWTASVVESDTADEESVAPSPFGDPEAPWDEVPPVGADTGPEFPAAGDEAPPRPDLEVAGSLDEGPAMAMSGAWSTRELALVALAAVQPCMPTATIRQLDLKRRLEPP
jgi:hypothetical protein